jgi:tetratricopeptide (TPR) repeat protein
MSSYLTLWGWNRRLVELTERLLGKLGDSYSELIVLISQGQGHLGLGQAKRAVGCYEQALAIARLVADRRRQRISHRGLGRCYSDHGRTALAIDFLEQALAIKRHVGDRRSDRITLTHLGRCYSDLGRTAQAIGYHEQALAIKVKFGDRRGEGIDQSDLGRCYSDLGETAAPLSIVNGL